MINNDSAVRFLVSYYYYKNFNLEKFIVNNFNNIKYDIFIDSGAFSDKSNSTNIYGYIEYIRKYSDYITVYSNFDIIDDFSKTIENQTIMEKEGLDPIPVFHIDSPIEYLQHYLSNYEYIALGGMVKYAKKPNVLTKKLEKIFDLIDDSKKIHSFGIAAWQIISRFPWYSIDSSSWTRGMRFKEVSIFDHEKPGFRSIKLWDLPNDTKWHKLIESYGFTYKDIGIKDSYNRKGVGSISAMSYLRAENWIRKNHHLFTPALKDNLKIYLSDACGDLRDTKNFANHIASNNLFNKLGEI